MDILFTFRESICIYYDIINNRSRTNHMEIFKKIIIIEN